MQPILLTNVKGLSAHSSQQGFKKYLTNLFINTGGVGSKQSSINNQSADTTKRFALAYY